MNNYIYLCEEIAAINNLIIGRNLFAASDVTVEINLIDNCDGQGYQMYSFAEIFSKDTSTLVSIQGTPEEALNVLREKLSEKLSKSSIANN